MAKVSFVVFSLSLLLSIQFVVGQNEDEEASPELGAIQFFVEQNEDEAASPELGAIQFVVGQNEDEAASPELVMSDFGEHFNKIITDPAFKSKLVEKFKSSVVVWLYYCIARWRNPNFQSGVAKLVEKYKSSVRDDSESVDGTTSTLVDEVAASSESEVENDTEIVGGLYRKMGKDDLKKMSKAFQYDESNGNTENEKN
ncbi:hypothetical protein GOBAR_AA01426 [Gossypium barbadense]|uniref:Uncharacterized protein n=1 Tax=Gossypium barbadense TaxID=3634 RepID=A0A2P5YU49_GOSBA|nr:hypothetical protein GOBAR_AA01426 [Gossypium barbadense]